MLRAVLRHRSLIVLDEATSGIDFATDSKIQKAIRDEITNSLLLAVAHRLRTVIDYDRLIVLDKGRVTEFSYTMASSGCPRQGQWLPSAVMKALESGSARSSSSSVAVELDEAQSPHFFI
ncbi:hypothetical protein BDZ89DRAFT_987643 [Hymenopellis radicata]|nr:hypothetical protein BDZ89DRAFT_987643 [Hymenopellis radicata]